MLTSTLLVYSLLQVCTTKPVLLLDHISQLQRESPRSSPYSAVQTVFAHLLPSIYLFPLTSQAQFPYMKNFVVPKYVYHSHCWFLLITPHILSQELCAGSTMLQNQFFLPVYSSETTFPSPSHRYGWGGLSIWNYGFFSIKLQIQTQHCSMWSCTGGTLC